MVDASNEFLRDTPLNAKQIAEYFGISLAGAYNLMRHEDFPSFRVGSRVLVRPSRLRGWLNDRETKGGDATDCSIL